MAALWVYRARYFNTVSAPPPNGALGVHDPFGADHLGEQRVEPIRPPQRRQVAREAESSPLEGGAEPAEELAPEHPAEDADREEEVVTAGDPTAPVEREPAAGDDAMDVRVQHEVLAPGVQHRQHADFGPEVFGFAATSRRVFAAARISRP